MWFPLASLKPSFVKTLVREFVYTELQCMLERVVVTTAEIASSILYQTAHKTVIFTISHHLKRTGFTEIFISKVNLLKRIEKAEWGNVVYKEETAALRVYVHVVSFTELSCWYSKIPGFSISKLVYLMCDILLSKLH